jgi:hypothetical protein
VAGKIYEALRSRFTNKRNNVLLAEFKPKRKVDLKDKELLSDDEENDADDAAETEIDRIDLNPKKGITREEAASTERTVSELPQKTPETVPEPKTTVNIKPDSKVFNPIVIEYKKDSDAAETAPPTQITRPRVVGVNP